MDYMREIALVLCAVYCFWYAKLSLKNEIPEEVRFNDIGSFLAIIMGILSIFAAIQPIIGYIIK